MARRTNDSEVANSIRKGGSILSLSAIGGTIVAAAVIGVFSNTFRNTVMFTPLVDSVDKLTVAISQSDSRNLEEHRNFMNTLAQFQAKMQTNEAKLERVMKDCNANQLKIDKCKDLLYQHDITPFSYLKEQ